MTKLNLLFIKPPLPLLARLSKITSNYEEKEHSGIYGLHMASVH